MKKLSTIKRSDRNTYFTNKENTIKFPCNLADINYETRVNLQNKTYYTKEEDADKGVPTINELLKSGQLVEHTYVNEHRIRVKGCDICWTSPKKIDIKAIQKEFAENGIKVSERALKFVCNAWKNGFKVGYRGKGVHLFVPCGDMNPLYITASKTDPHFREWQTTYVC
jgi:hypothetical protein